MIKIGRSVCVIIGLFFVVISCNTTDQIDDKYTVKLDSIREIYIPDKRLDVWNLEIEKKDNELILKGETSSMKGFEILDEEFGIRFPEIRIAVETLPDKNLKGKTYGIINVSVGNMRSAPKHSAELVTQTLFGTPVIIFKEENDGWYLIQTPDRYLGWIDSKGVALKTKEELDSWKKHRKFLYLPQYGFAYEQADAGSVPVSDLATGNLLSVLDSVADFYKVLYPDDRVGFVKQTECQSVAEWLPKADIKVEALLKTALKFRGIPYLWGGTSSKSIDCSGFTKTVFFMHGIVLQRDASQQILYGDLVDTSEGYESLQPGDLLFFGRRATEDLKEKVTHVGIYIGDTEIIHASGLVRINSVDKSRPNYTEHYVNNFIRAKRVINKVGTSGIERVSDNEFYKLIISEL